MNWHFEIAKDSRTVRCNSEREMVFGRTCCFFRCENFSPQSPVAICSALQVLACLIFSAYHPRVRHG